MGERHPLRVPGRSRGVDHGREVDAHRAESAALPPSPDLPLDVGDHRDRRRRSPPASGTTSARSASQITAAAPESASTWPSFSRLIVGLSGEKAALRAGSRRSRPPPRRRSGAPPRPGRPAGRRARAGPPRARQRAGRARRRSAFAQRRRPPPGPDRVRRPRAGPRRRADDHAAPASARRSRDRVDRAEVLLGDLDVLDRTP